MTHGHHSRPGGTLCGLELSWGKALGEQVSPLHPLHMHAHIHSFPNLCLEAAGSWFLPPGADAGLPDPLLGHRAQPTAGRPGLQLQGKALPSPPKSQCNHIHSSHRRQEAAGQADILNPIGGGLGNSSGDNPLHMKIPRDSVSHHPSLQALPSDTTLNCLLKESF